MTIGIYSITHIDSGKRYIGKSINIERRLSHHKCSLRKPTLSKKSCNRYLHHAVQKYGWDAFTTEVLESFDFIDESLLTNSELKWMDYFNSYDLSNGYNLRRDSSTKSIVHDDTKKLISENNTGCGNPNYGNNWSDSQKSNMSDIAKKRHADGFYGDEWKRKISQNSKKMWKDEELKSKMAKKVAKAKQKYKFHQYTKSGVLITTWDSVKDILDSNPSYKWQNIYSVCNGYKKSYMGYVWKKELKI